jgi:peroxiredoxin Q/BCP
MAVKALKVGDRLPVFSTVDHDGNVVTSGDLVGRGPFVVYFYPADDTPGCTAQACEFRDQYEVFTDAGARVIGISGDSPAKHRAFREKHRLPFQLLSDEKSELKNAFGVPNQFFIAQRITFVFSSDGVVEKVFSSHLQPRKHISESLDVLIGKQGVKMP